MPTEIRITRDPPFLKSDALREDAALHAEAQKLGAWLATREVDLVTMDQVLTYARSGHADATLVREPVRYAWVWDPERKLWYLACIDRGTVSFVPSGEQSPVLVQITVSARY